MVQNFRFTMKHSRNHWKPLWIAIDQYEVVKELAGEAAESFIQRVSRDGAGLGGIYLAVTTSRDGAMRSAARNNFKVRIGGFNFDEWTFFFVGFEFP